MEDSRIIALIARKMEKTASPEELGELAALMAEGPAYGYFHELMESLQGGEGPGLATREELEEGGWQQLEKKLGEEKRSILRPVMRWAAAAVVAGAVTMGIVWQVQQPVKAVQQPVMQLADAGIGTTRQVVLPDGTKVWLNAGSTLTYPAVFSGTAREVRLEGEGFFEVAKGSKAPFSVHAGRITVGVLGTSFNVKAYKDDKEIETTLISGKVQVTLDNEPEKPILLSPREKLTVMNAAADTVGAQAGGTAGTGLRRSYNALRYKVQSIPLEAGDVVMETAWVSHKLVISDESFEAVAHMLERKFDVAIRFEDGQLRQEHLSGVFEKEGIGEILNILAMTTSFHYRMTGRTVSIYK